MAHPARIYDYWLGGKDNFAADRIAAEEVLTVMPAMAQVARSVRMFLAAVVHHLAADVGIRQFLDIGTGIPTAANTHEVAQGVAPECRIVYVDNDPMVLAHARALLASSPEGATDYLDADLRDTGAIIERAAATLDFSQPVAVILIGTLTALANHAPVISVPGAQHTLQGVPVAFSAATHNAVTLADPEPWPKPVDGAMLLAELTNTLTRFAVFPKGGTTTLAFPPNFTRP